MLIDFSHSSLEIPHWNLHALWSQIMDEGQLAYIKEFCLKRGQKSKL